MSNVTEAYPGKEISTDQLKQQLVTETEIKQAKEAKFPTEIVDLPSKGLLYPEGHPLRSGKVEMKYMTAKEEDILTSQNLIQKGVVIDLLLQSLLISNGEGKRIQYSDLVLGDKNAIMVAARILGYGADYSVEIACTKCSTKQAETIDLASLENKEVPESTTGNIFEYILPLSKKTLTYKLLTHGDEENVVNESKRMKKRSLDKLQSYDLTSRLKQIITAVDGDDDKANINSFIENEFISRDSLSFRKELERITPDVDMKIHFECDNCGHQDSIDLPMTVDFFWPRV